MDIKTIQEKRQLSHHQLARECFVCKDVLRRLIQGESAGITFKNLDRLLRYCQKWRYIIDEDKTIK